MLPREEMCTKTAKNRFETSRLRRAFFESYEKPLQHSDRECLTLIHAVSTEARETSTEIHRQLANMGDANKNGGNFGRACGRIREGAF
jgi:hypothetical protein